MYSFKEIGFVKSDFKEKFGIPRQSGLCNAVSYIVLNKEYQKEDAFRGIEEYSHLWLVWYFSKINQNDNFVSTVRPPKLGGNKRVGVFATRSPNRPNPIGLSCVKFLGMEKTQGNLCLKVSGADLLDGTPILDIKPYLPYTDCVKNSVGGFGEEASKVRLYVDFPQDLLKLIPPHKQEVIKEVLSLDPRPGYQNDQRLYGVKFAEYNIKFVVKDDTVFVKEVEVLTI